MAKLTPEQIAELGLDEPETKPGKLTAERIAALGLDDPEPAGPSVGESVRRGATQGATLGFGDEVTAALSAPILKAIGKLSSNPAYRDMGEKSLAELYRQSRDRERGENDRAREAHGGAYLGGELGGAVLSAFVPGASALNVGKGAKLSQTLAKSAALGGIAGAGNSRADSVGGMAADTAAGAALGGAIGGTGHALGRALGAVGRRSANKVMSIDEDVARAMNAEAASGTATARSAAGTSAQDAYKQLEHLRELGRLGKLTPEKRAAAAKLEQELADKAEEKLLPAVARKEEAAAAYREALESEGSRASKLVDEKLSGSEFKQQVGARLKRYGLPAAIGAIGGGLGLGPVGMAGGAAVGGMVGAGFRPMVHSLLRLKNQPVVQRAVHSRLQSLAGAEPVMSPVAAQLSRQLDPDTRALIEALRRRPTQVAQAEEE